MRAFTGARADAGRGCALSPLEPRGWPGRWSGREGPGGSGPACVAGESYAPGLRPGSRTQFRWRFFLLLLLNLLAPSLLHPPPHSPPTFQASLISPEEWKVAER